MVMCVTEPKAIPVLYVIENKHLSVYVSMLCLPSITAAVRTMVSRWRLSSWHEQETAVQEADQHKPGNAYFLACLSKQWSDITFIPETLHPEAKACAERGLAFAEKVSPPHPSCVACWKTRAKKCYPEKAVVAEG